MKKLNQLFLITRAPEAEPTTASALRVMLHRGRPDSEWNIREIPAQIEGEEDDATKAFRRALEEIKTGLKNAGFKRTVAEIQALLDDYPVIQQPIPVKPEQGEG